MNEEFSQDDSRRFRTRLWPSNDDHEPDPQSFLQSASPFSSPAPFTSMTPFETPSDPVVWKEATSYFNPSAHSTMSEGLSHSHSNHSHTKQGRNHLRRTIQHASTTSMCLWCRKSAVVLVVAVGLMIGIVFGAAIGLYATEQYSDIDIRQEVRPMVAKKPRRPELLVKLRPAYGNAIPLPQNALPRVLVGNAAAPKSVARLTDSEFRPQQSEHTTIANVNINTDIRNQNNDDDDHWTDRQRKKEEASAVQANANINSSIPTSDAENRVIDQLPKKRKLKTMKGRVEPLDENTRGQNQTHSEEGKTQAVDEEYASDKATTAHKDVWACSGLKASAEADDVAPGAFDVVLLATYPRTGSSWTRTLLRGATQIKSDLTTVRGLASLDKAATMSPWKNISNQELGKIYRQFGVEWISSEKKGRPLYGIKGNDAIEQNTCAQHYSQHKQHADDPWPYSPETPPLLVKTHFPQIGDDATEAFTKKAKRIVHIIRNPFDTIASRYLGNQRQHQDRFDQLKKARETGETTEEFVRFIERESDRIQEWHEYWLERKLEDAELGLHTLYVRYEKLCEKTEQVLGYVTDFVGYQTMPESLGCTLSSFKCHSKPEDFPIHLDLFTEEQIEAIAEVQKDMLKQHGYNWNPGTKSLSLMPTEIMCDDW